MGSRLRSRLEVEDVLQETFAVAYETIGGFSWRDEESFYRWLGSIPEHLLWSLSQKKAWDEQSTNDGIEEIIVPYLKQLEAGETLDPKQILLAHPGLGQQIIEALPDCDPAALSRLRGGSNGERYFSSRLRP